MTFIQHLKEARARQPAASVALAAGWRARMKHQHVHQYRLKIVPPLSKRVNEPERSS
jgi:hypothetical protein